MKIYTRLDYVIITSNENRCTKYLGVLQEMRGTVFLNVIERYFVNKETTQFEITRLSL